MHKSVAQLGFWSAVAVTLLTAVFFISLVWPHPWLMFAASLLLASAFVAMMTGLHYATEPARRVWSHLGLSFAVIYAVLCSLTYYLQLTFVRHNYLPVAEAAILPFRFIPGTPMFAQDMLGYAFLCAATLTVGFSLSDGTTQRWIKWLYIVHGALFIVPTLLVPAILLPVNETGTGLGDAVGRYANMGWSAYFGVAAGLTALWFYRAGDLRR